MLNKSDLYFGIGLSMLWIGGFLWQLWKLSISFPPSLRDVVVAWIGFVDVIFCTDDDIMKRPPLWSFVASCFGIFVWDFFWMGKGWDNILGNTVGSRI